MADNRKGKDKRYFFTLGQMVLLGGGFVLAATIIFVLGIVVGQEIESRKSVKPEDPLVKVPVKPSAGAGAPGGAGKEELTFYDTLKRPPASEPSGETKGERQARTDAKPKNSGGKTDAPAKTAEKKPAAGRDAAPPNGAKETAERKANDRPWSVQVNAYPDERSAKQLVDRLKNKGYNAVVTEFENNGKTWYRVRVGRYSTREEADKAVEVLKSKENFTSAFAAR